MKKHCSVLKLVLSFALLIVYQSVCSAEYEIDAVLSGFGRATANTSYQSIVLLGGQEVIGSSVTSTYDLGIGHIYHLPLAATTYYEPPVPGSTPYWPSAYGNNTNTCITSLVSGPQREAILSTGTITDTGEIIVPPVVDSRGVVFISVETTLKMYDPETGIVYDYYGFADNIVSVSIGNSDELYVLTDNYRIYKFVDGVIVWVSATYNALSPLALGYTSSNEIYAINNNTVIAFSMADGRESWALDVTDNLGSENLQTYSPTLGREADNRLYISGDRRVVAVDIDTHYFVWATSACEYMDERVQLKYSPSVDSNGNIYSVIEGQSAYMWEPGLPHNYVSKINLSGTRVWSKDYGSTLPVSIPAMISNEKACVVTDYGLDALNTLDGSTTWQYVLSINIPVYGEEHIAVDKDGIVFVWSEDPGMIYAINGNNGFRVWNQPFFFPSTTATFIPVLSQGGVLHIVSTDGKLANFSHRELPQIKRPDGSNTGRSSRTEYVNGIKRRGNVRPISTPMTGDIKETANSFNSMNTVTGNLYYYVTDLSLPGKGLPLHFTRSYNSMMNFYGPFGYGWAHPFDTRVRFEQSDGSWTLFRGDAAEINFVYNNEDGYFYPPKGTTTKLQWDTENNIVNLYEMNGIRYEYNAQNCALQHIIDPYGNTVSFEYLPGYPDKLCKIIDTAGREIQIEYNDDLLINLMVDPLGRGTTYSYENTLLTRVDYPGGLTAEYLYDNNHRLISHNDKKYANKRFAIRQYEYDSNNRVVRQDGPVYDEISDTCYISYDDTYRKNTFTNSRGKSTVIEYDSSGRVVYITNAVNQVKSFIWDENNDNTYMTDYGNDTYGYTYYDDGNIHTITTPVGSVSYTYTEDYKKVETFTDERNKLYTYTYDTFGNLKTVTDPELNTSSYTYNASGQLVSYVDANGNSTSYGYDTWGNRTTVTNAEGKTTRYCFDILGRSTGTVDALERLTKYVLDPEGTDRVKQIIYVSDGSKDEEFTYDDFGNLTEHINANDEGKKTFKYTYHNQLEESEDEEYNKVVYIYDANGNRTQTTDAKGNITTFTYDNLDRLTAITAPYAIVTSYEYDDDGNRKSVTDPNGHKTLYNYDNMNRLTSVVDAMGNTMSYGYDEAGNRTTITDARGSTTTYVYDDLNRTSEIHYPNGGHSHYYYDKVGNTEKIIDANGYALEYGYNNIYQVETITDEENHTAQFTYDEVGNLESKTDANGNTIQYTYYPRNWVKEEKHPGTTLKVTEYQYDNVGNLKKVIDPLGKTVEYAYYTNGWKKSVTDANTNTTNYDYDANGNLRHVVTPKSQTIEYQYDNLNRRTMEIDEIGNDILYGYDAAGNVISRTNGTDVVVSTYNAVNRLVRKTYPDNTTVEYGYDANYNLITAITPDVETRYEYNTLDRLTVVKQKFLTGVPEPVEYTVAHEYDLVGNRTRVVYPGGTKDTLFAYNTLNRMESLTDDDAGTINFSYDPVGNSTSVVYPNGITAQYAYNTNNWLERIDYNTSNIPYQHYTYNNAGMKTLMSDPDGDTEYGYDNLYQLTQVTYPGGRQQKYEYDDIGNRTKYTDWSGTMTYQYNNANMLTSYGVILNTGTVTGNYDI
ncbi:MAG: DUF6531 domain-containing protein, partial [Elusimicrobiota bacterium]